MDSEGEHWQANKWTKVRSKKKRRRSPASSSMPLPLPKEKNILVSRTFRRKDDVSSARSSCTATGTVCVQRNGFRPRPVHVPVQSASQPEAKQYLRIQEKIARDTQLNNWICRLASKTESQIIFDLRDDRNFIYILEILKQGWAAELSHSIVHIFSILPQCRSYAEIERLVDIPTVLERLNMRMVTVKSLLFFSDLCTVYTFALEHGSNSLKKWLSDTKLVLQTIGETFECLNPDRPESQEVVARLQNADNRLNLLMFSQYDNVTLEGNPQNSKETLRIPAQHVAHQAKVGRRAHDKGESWQTVATKKKIPKSIRPGCFMDTNQVGRIVGCSLEKKHGKETWVPSNERNGAVAGGADENGNLKISVTKQERAKLFSKLHENWTPQELPRCLKEVMYAVSDLSHQKRNDDEVKFLSRLCTPQFLEYLTASLNLSELMKVNVTASFFTNIGTFCIIVCKYLPLVGAEYCGKMVELILKAYDAVNLPLALPSQLQRELGELYSKLVQTTYVSEDLCPVNFRQMSVVPTAEDFQTQRVFLRPNIISGPYRDVDHYLDVQFRLLREDFLKSIRDSVAEIRGRAKNFENTGEKRWNTFRIYKNVTFGTQTDGRTPGCLQMVFDPYKDLNIDWKMSKRFMVGALLVISNDNFSTLHLARVAGRDFGYLNHGWLPVEPFGSDGSAKKLLRGIFTVAESMIFFEPYFHVLNCLQKTEVDAFPLARYIVNADTTEELADYLKSESNRVYRIPLGRPGSPECQSVSVDVVNGQWPTPLEMGLNGSQHEALIKALTQKVMLIQGPPGTGKTFLGLRVVSTLLMNPHAWRGVGSEASPILIVCYTNHALDQFLVGLLDTTKEIVRLGGRCKDTRLENYMLKRGGGEKQSLELRREYGRRRRAQEEVENDLHHVQDALHNLSKTRGIISMQTFLQHHIITETQHNVIAEHCGISSWLEKGCGEPVISANERRSVMSGFKSGNYYVDYEVTLSNMSSSIQELRRMRTIGIRDYIEMQQYLQSRYDYFVSQTQKNWMLSPDAARDDLMSLEADERWQIYQ